MSAPASIIDRIERDRAIADTDPVWVPCEGLPECRSGLWVAAESDIDSPDDDSPATERCPDAGHLEAAIEAKGWLVDARTGDPVCDDCQEKAIDAWAYGQKVDAESNRGRVFPRDLPACEAGHPECATVTGGRCAEVAESLITCRRCHGDSRQSLATDNPCPACGGTGHVGWLLAATTAAMRGRRAS